MSKSNGTRHRWQRTILSAQFSFLALVIIINFPTQAQKPPGAPTKSARSSLLQTKLRAAIAGRLIEKTSEALGCPEFSDDFWDALYAFPLKKSSFPSAANLGEAIEQTLFTKVRLQNLTPADHTRVRESILKLYAVITQDTPRILGLELADRAQLMETLTALELGDRSTPERAEAQNRIQQGFTELSKTLQSLDGDLARCPQIRSAARHATTPLVDSPTTLFQLWKSSRHPLVYGALKVLATAYQSCNAGQAQAMSAGSPSLQGIAVVGTHADGVGLRREIRDLPALLRNHFYLASYQRPSNACFDVRSKPMIYDYGGKPFATTDVSSKLNFFLDAGSGTSELGIDCSGFVYSALASAGLKVREVGRLKAISAWGINARMYMNPSNNGLTCLEPATFSGASSLLPGDILATTGHVVIIASTTSDPFGIANISDPANCKAANIATSRFNFTLLQSAPVYNGIGINQVSARDYLASEGSMKSGMIEFAVSACKARFGKTRILSSSPSASLVRHKGSAGCLDNEIKLEDEECVANCPLTKGRKQIM